MTARTSRRATLLTIAYLAILSGCGSHQADTPQSKATVSDSVITITPAQRGQIQTQAVAVQRFNPTIYTTGTVNFNGDKSTDVIPAISGPVSRLLVDLGDSVVAGQALATVASPDFAADVANYRKAETAWKNAQRIELLDEKLFANDALAHADLDQAKADLGSAEADRQAALLQLSSLGIDSASIDAIRDGKQVPGGQAAIRAPIPGVIVARLITPGQLLQAGAAPAFTIADLSTVWVIGNVFEADIGSVSKGQPTMIRSTDGADSVLGRVDYVGAEVDPQSKATAVRIVAPNAGARLKENMLVQLEIRGARARSGIVVPVSAVLRDDDNLPFVYVAGGTDQFLRRRITLGGRTGDNYQVTAGLNVGDMVVIQGALYLEEVGSQ